MALQRSVSLTQAAEQGKLKEYLNQYLESCMPKDSADSDHPTHRLFPNLAGFCYWMGCGISKLEALGEDYPDEVDYIKTVLEDEALNSTFQSPAIIQAYLKKRLGYSAEKKKSPRNREQKIICIYEPGPHEENREDPPPQDQAPKRSRPGPTRRRKTIRPEKRKFYLPSTHRHRNPVQKIRTVTPLQPHRSPPRPPP